MDCEHMCYNTKSCFPIPLSVDDEMAVTVDGERRNCIPFTRSAGIKFNTEGASPYSNQINEPTAFLDGSTVYGSSEFLGILLKDSQKKGHLRTGPECNNYPQGEMLPECPESAHSYFCECNIESCPEKYLAGDARVNEQPMLTVMHTLWVREHNRIANILTKINPCWDSNKVYEETRKVIIAMIQHITYRLYLPILLGPSGYNIYVGYNNQYDSGVKPKLINSFASAAFRFGHSQIPPSMPVADKNWRIKPVTEELHRTLFKARLVCEAGFDNIMRGLLSVAVNEVDENFTEDIQERLFAPSSHHVGLDLLSLNLQRARDHGIPPYLRYKQFCEEKYNVKARFANEEETILKLRKIYNDLDKVDLFIGAMLEESVNDGLIGPTFACIIGEQFKQIKNGDRFFYTNKGLFDERQLEEIYKSDISALSCDNTLTLDKVPRRSFLFDSPR